MTVNDIIVIVICSLAVIALVYLMIHQRGKVLKWLIWAVSEAEKTIGEKTGELKLYTVYNWFCERFPKFAAIVPFWFFSKWVDIALKTMKDWIKANNPIAQYITGKDNKNESKKQTY